MLVQSGPYLQLSTCITLPPNYHAAGWYFGASGILVLSYTKMDPVPLKLEKKTIVSDGRTCTQTDHLLGHEKDL